METAILKGRTYSIRQALRALGASWNAKAYGWEMPVELLPAAKALLKRANNDKRNAKAEALQAEIARKEKAKAAFDKAVAEYVPGARFLKALSAGAFHSEHEQFAKLKAALVPGLKLNFCTNFMLSRGTVYSCEVVEVAGVLKAKIISTSDWWSTVYSDSDTSKAGEIFGVVGIAQLNGSYGYQLDLGYYTQLQNGNG